MAANFPIPAAPGEQWVDPATGFAWTWDGVKWLLSAGGGGGGGAGVVGPPGPSAYEVAVANGFVGTEAEWVASLEGEVGPQGLAGADGAQGPAGADSTVPGPQGEVGPAGADSTVPGPQGEIGPQGPAGADSTVPGPQGPAGVDGVQGPAGPSVASADAGNIIRLGGDGLLYTPDGYIAKNISQLPLLP